MHCTLILDASPYYRLLHLLHPAQSCFFPDHAAMEGRHAFHHTWQRTKLPTLGADQADCMQIRTSSEGVAFSMMRDESTTGVTLSKAGPR